MRSLGLLTVGLATLVACDGGQTGDEEARCEVATSTALGLDDDSPLGFGPADVLAYAGGVHTGPLAWEVGGTTEVTLDAAQSGEIAYVEYEWVDHSGQDIATIGCENQVEIDVTLGFSTADGAFDETIDTRIVAGVADRATLFVALDLDDLTGTYEVTTETDTSDFDAVSAFLSTEFAPTSWSGVVEGQGEGTDGSGSDDTAFAQSFGIAEWSNP